MVLSKYFSLFGLSISLSKNIFIFNAEPRVYLRIPFIRVTVNLD